MTYSFNGGEWEPDPYKTVAVAMVCLLIFAIVQMCTTSCAVQKPAVVVKDSVRVEIRERVVRDTVTVELPGSVIERTTPDTVSTLSSAYASSTAAIRDGYLYHSLTSGGAVEVPVTVTVHDTTVVEKQAETVFVDVPRKASGWEHFVEGCGYFALGILALAAVAFSLKIAGVLNF